MSPFGPQRKTLRFWADLSPQKGQTQPGGAVLTWAGRRIRVARVALLRSRDGQPALTVAITASLGVPRPVEVVVTRNDLLAPAMAPLPTFTFRVSVLDAPAARLLMA